MSYIRSSQVKKHTCKALKLNHAVEKLPHFKFFFNLFDSMKGKPQLAFGMCNTSALGGIVRISEVSS